MDCFFFLKIDLCRLYDSHNPESEGSASGIFRVEFALSVIGEDVEEQRQSLFLHVTVHRVVPESGYHSGQAPLVHECPFVRGVLEANVLCGASGVV